MLAANAAARSRIKNSSRSNLKFKVKSYKDYSQDDGQVQCQERKNN